MILLAAADTIAGGASAASVLTCSIFGMELSSGTETYKTLYQGQLGASPATIYTTPGSTEAFIKSIMIVNTSTTVRHTFQLFRGGTGDGNAITPVFTIKPGHLFLFEENFGWRCYNSNGELIESFGPYIDLQDYSPTGYFAETFDRNYLNEVNVSLLSTGRLSMQAIWLQAGDLVTNIAFASATTPAGTPTNQLFGLYDLDRNLLGTTSNDTTTAWAANTIKSLALTTPFKVKYTGLYYLGIMVTATTVPTIKGTTAPAASQLHGTAPILNGTSNTGLTTSLPNPANAISVTTTNAWGAVS